MSDKFIAVLKVIAKIIGYIIAGAAGSACSGCFSLPIHLS